jgi:methylthioribose-1-phosphate isomerase
LVERLVRNEEVSGSIPLGSTSFRELHMRAGGREHRTIWTDDRTGAVCVIDQTRLPHAFEVVELRSRADAERAIRDMIVRGAPLIGVTAAYGMALAMREDGSDAGVRAAAAALAVTRPTAVNLRWALDRLAAALLRSPAAERSAVGLAEAAALADEDAATCAAIGRHGEALLRDAFAQTGRDRLEILTHCNAGWLATVDWGTALAPIYAAHRAGAPLHVWVDETRPRNQGASLTAWELAQEGVPHTVIVDNAGGHLMQHGRVDLVLVGSDRTTRTGDVCNKIGTYLKALAAADNGVPFYAALPLSTIDWRLSDGLREIPIEERGAEEVTHMRGLTADGRLETVRLTPAGSPAANWAFDVTPARLITGGIITERGIVSATGLAAAFPELAGAD